MQKREKIGVLKLVNIDRLKAALKEQNIGFERAAHEIGIDPATFYRRLSKDGKKFTVEEVSKLATLLDLDCNGLHRIFFDN